ncbi:hypothetical protein GBA52_026802 [Prunus armeniaca]|nr:hypothetical protein GBA52_026802 [Prunus armeniaca]
MENCMGLLLESATQNHPNSSSSPNPLITLSFSTHFSQTLRTLSSPVALFSRLFRFGNIVASRLLLFSSPLLQSDICCRLVRCGRYSNFYNITSSI